MANGEGVIDGNPMAFMLFIYMAFVMIFFIGNNSVSPIAGNSTITAKINTGYNNMKWFLALFAPIGAYILMKGWNEISDRKSNEEAVDEGEGEGY